MFQVFLFSIPQASSILSVQLAGWDVLLVQRALALIPLSQQTLVSPKRREFKAALPMALGDFVSTCRFPMGQPVMTKVLVPQETHAKVEPVPGVPFNAVMERAVPLILAALQAAVSIRMFWMAPHVMTAMPVR